MPGDFITENLKIAFLFFVAYFACFSSCFTEVIPQRVLCIANYLLKRATCNQSWELN